MMGNGGQLASLLGGGMNLNSLSGGLQGLGGAGMQGNSGGSNLTPQQLEALLRGSQNMNMNYMGGLGKH